MRFQINTHLNLSQKSVLSLSKGHRVINLSPKLAQIGAYISYHLSPYNWTLQPTALPLLPTPREAWSLCEICMVSPSTNNGLHPQTLLPPVPHFHFPSLIKARPSFSSCRESSPRAEERRSGNQGVEVRPCPRPGPGPALRSEHQRPRRAGLQKAFAAAQDVDAYAPFFSSPSSSHCSVYTWQKRQRIQSCPILVRC